MILTDHERRIRRNIALFDDNNNAERLEGVDVDGCGASETDVQLPAYLICMTRRLEYTIRLRRTLAVLKIVPESDCQQAPLTAPHLHRIMRVFPSMRYTGGPMTGLDETCRCWTCFESPAIMHRVSQY